MLIFMERQEPQESLGVWGHGLKLSCQHMANSGPSRRRKRRSLC